MENSLRPEEMNEVFGPEGVLAGKLPGYEFRSGQLQFAVIYRGAVCSGIQPDVAQF